MQTRLITLAIAGALVAPAAMAQTPNPVTLYGLLFGTLESVEARGGSASVPQRMRVEDHSSRLGVRGTEDLGGGLKGFFQLETAFRIDSNNTTFAARNSGVGLLGEWGSVILGRWDSPYKVAGYPADPWNLLTLAGYWNTIQDGGNFGRRAQNVVQYWTPTIAGFSARVAVTSNEGKTASANPRDVSAMIGWARGPLVINVAWEEHQDQVGSTATAGSEEEGLMVAGSFTFGSLKIGGVAEEIKKTGRTKQKNFYISAKQAFGSHAIVGTLGKSKDGDVVGRAQPESDTYSIAYEYRFSRRTSAHLMYAQIDNNSVGVRNFPLIPIPGITAGSDPRGVSLGILHTF
jgi:predicted porin